MARLAWPSSLAAQKSTYDRTFGKIVELICRDEETFENLRHCDDPNSRFFGKEQTIDRRGILHLLRLRSGTRTSD